MSSAPDQIYGVNLDDPLDQIEFITGSNKTPIRIRAVYCDRTAVGRRAFEYEGALADIAERTQEHNIDGCNIYMVAQKTIQLPKDKYFTVNEDISGVRCLYADGDESDLPSTWHVEPTFILVHPKTKRWWAYWKVTYALLGNLRDLIKRIAVYYDADISISNPARIVRLAGYDRWKDGENYGPYELHRHSGTSSEEWEHHGIPRLPVRNAYTGSTDAESVIELNRLKQLLLLVPPGDREVWLKVMFMTRDGTIINEKFEILDDADKVALFDSWASGELYSQMTGFSL
jgi:hypothetical protein